MQQAAPAPISQLSDEELLRLCASQSYDSPEWEELSKRLLAKMEHIFRVCVFGQNAGPRDVDREEFVKDCMSRVKLKLIKALRTSQPENLDAYLWTTGKNVIVEEVRARKGRGGTRTFVDIETLCRSLTASEEMPVETGPEYGELKFRKDPSLIVEERERQEFINTLLTIGGGRGTKRDRDCCLWIREHLNGTDITEISKRRGTTKDDVWAMFRHDYGSLYGICKELFPKLRLKDINI